jgi:hypothetical protein
MTVLLLLMSASALQSTKISEMMDTGMILATKAGIRKTGENSSLFATEIVKERIVHLIVTVATGTTQTVKMAAMIATAPRDAMETDLMTDLTD